MPDEQPPEFPDDMPEWLRELRRSAIERDARIDEYGPDALLHDLIGYYRFRMQLPEEEVRRRCSWTVDLFFERIPGDTPPWWPKA
jgi:hypothetical protein